MLGVMETPDCEDWAWLGEGGLVKRRGESQRDPRGLGQPSPGKNQKSGKGLEGRLDEPRARGGAAAEMEKRLGVGGPRASLGLGRARRGSGPPQSFFSWSFYCFKPPSLPAR